MDCLDNVTDQEIFNILLFNSIARTNTRITQLALNLGANPNACNDKNKTPLICASKITKMKIRHIVDLLLQAQTFVNVKDGEKERTPLMWAAEKGNIWLIKILLEAGADVNLQDKDGNTALIIATISKKKDVACMLLEAGCQ